MKMIYAGIANTPGAAPENWLYNCTRNPACQKPFYIPIVDFSDFMLYFDLPGKPSLFSINLIPCEGGVPIPVQFCNYVAAQTPTNDWYAVFTQPVLDSYNLTKFYVNATFTIGSTEYQYYSNQFEFVTCEPVVKVESCFNDPSVGASAFDCNGVYYGFHAGDDTPVGNSLLRYIHHAYVRYGEVIENSNKMQITLFNSRTAYKNYVTRDSLFQFELIPGFYKDVLLGVIERGNIAIDGAMYTLSEQQEFGITNDSLKWWKMDIKLSDLCKQWFSCTPTTCVPADPICENDFTTAEYVPAADEINEHVHLSGGILNPGDSITWSLLIDTMIVDSGTSETEDIFFNIALDVEANCYTLVWEKHCECAAAPVFEHTFRYGFADQEFGDGFGGTIDKTTFPYQYTGVYTPGQPLVTQFIGMPIDKFIGIEYPDTETYKTTWKNTEANYGEIPDFVMNSIVSAGGKNYITSRVAMTLDNSFTTVFE